MSNFDQKSKKKFGIPKVGQKSEGPKSLTDVPQVLVATDPAAADQKLLEALEKHDPKAVEWIKSLDLPVGAITYEDVRNWLLAYYQSGLTTEKFKRIRTEKKCPNCGRSWCPFARSEIAEIMGW